MNFRSLAVTTGLALTVAASSVYAEGLTASQSSGGTVIDIAGHQVPVVTNGLYDRYRSNPPLSVVQAERPDLDLSWFETLDKTRVDIGFESYSPNFYYENSRVTAIYTADLERLRELMPAAVLEQVQPLQVWPGRGVVAFTGYSYQYCDNDSYNEISLAIVTSKPGGWNLGPLSLLGQSMSSDFWGYVLKLPVDTELARVRGVVGYNLPKWLTGINFREEGDQVVFEIMDHDTGDVDVVFEGEKLSDLSNEVNLVTSNFTNLDQSGVQTRGHAVSRQLSHASTRDEGSARLILSDGNLSTYIKSLKLGKLLKYEYVPEFQSALYAPEQLSAYLDRD